MAICSFRTGFTLQISFNVGCGEINIKGTKENVREALGTFYQGIERVEGLIFPLSTQDVDILKNDETKEHFMSFLKDASINAVFTIDDNCIIIYAFEEHCIQLALQILQDNGVEYIFSFAVLLLFPIKVTI